MKTAYSESTAASGNILVSTTSELVWRLPADDDWSTESLAPARAQRAHTNLVCSSSDFELSTQAIAEEWCK
jgi:hypothetical protein